MAIFCPAMLAQKGGVLNSFCPSHISSCSSARRIPKTWKVVCQKVSKCPALFWGYFGGEDCIWGDNMENKEEKKEIKEGQLTLKWREYEGGHEKRELTPLTGQFGKGSVHTDLEYL